MTKLRRDDPLPLAVFVAAETVEHYESRPAFARTKIIGCMFYARQCEPVGAEGNFLFHRYAFFNSLFTFAVFGFNSTAASYSAYTGTRRRINGDGRWGKSTSVAGLFSLVAADRARETCSCSLFRRPFAARCKSVHFDISRILEVSKCL
jgi:hypothetical protein